jgi:hypothetical protein
MALASEKNETDALASGPNETDALSPWNFK